MSRPREPELDERLADFVDDRMSVRDRERFEAELRVNAALRQRVEDYRRTIEVMQQALRESVVKVDVAASVLDKIQRGEVVPTSPAPWQGASRRSLWLSGAVAAAAGLLLFALSRWEPAPTRTDAADQPARDFDVALLPAADAATADRRRLVDQATGQTQAPPPASEPTVGLLVVDAPVATAPSLEVPARERQQHEDPKVEAKDKSAVDDALAENKAVVGGTFGLPIVTASTMVPQVRFWRAGAAGELPALSADAAPMMQFFAGARLRSLTEILPTSLLQVQRLEALPPEAYRVASIEQGERQGAGMASGEATEAWLVEGSGPDVFDYLARLSEVSRGFGYQTSNGEVAASEVARLLPRSADEEKSSRSWTAQVEGVDHEQPAPVGATEADRGASSAAPGAPGSKAEAPGERAKQATDPDASARKEQRSRGAPAGDPAQGDVARDVAGNPQSAPASAPTPTASLPAATPATPGEPEPSAPPLRVRLVIVIDRGMTVPRTR